MTEEVKSSMSPEDRARRRAALGKTASEKIAKSEQLNFRLEEKSIKQLQAVALQKGVPIGSMVREWVLERLSEEELGKDGTPGKALQMLIDLSHNLDRFLRKERSTLHTDSTNYTIYSHGDATHENSFSNPFAKKFEGHSTVSSVDTAFTLCSGHSFFLTCIDRARRLQSCVRKNSLFKLS